MQGTEIEGEGAYIKYVTESEYRSNEAVGHFWDTIFFCTFRVL